MERLTRYLKNIKFFPHDNIGLFTSRLNQVQLRPGEFLPQLIPYDSWIFIEEGLVTELRGRNKKKATAVNVYFQGRSIEYKQEVNHKHPLGKRMLKAVEPTTLYYLPPMIYDELSRRVLYSAITHAMAKNNRFEMNFWKFLYSKNTSRKVHKVIKSYTSLLRIPAHHLYEYLRIESPHQKKMLRNAQSLYRKSHPTSLCPEDGVKNILSPTAMLEYTSNNQN